ncbi:uncharacterized [Tachysurus ichikawai]
MFREGFKGKDDVGGGDSPVRHSSDDLGRSGMRQHGGESSGREDVEDHPGERSLRDGQSSCMVLGLSCP